MPPTLHDGAVSREDARLLATLAAVAPAVVPHALLLACLWPLGGGTAEALTKRATRLRPKLRPGVALLAVPGGGYQLLA